ncbi:hypothetical protein PV325_000427 [Microctonus aethiopoides]|nr:hypothetical protein PV325_000427 [Microctonus aethiopoides]
MEFPGFRTADDFDTSEDYLTTGCTIIDKALRGGISRKGITQIYGEAGTGKTQLALQLCLTAQIPSDQGCQAGAIYICTESVFPSKRLQNLLEESPIAKEHNLNGDLIFIEHISTVNDLEICVINRLPILLSNRRIGLIIIDSIAAPYRVEYESTELRNRAKSFRNIGQVLHSYSRKFNIAVVCINQASSSIDDPISDENICIKINPVLGITWASQVTNSFCLCKFNGQRHIHTMESPYLSRKLILFEIKESGVHGLSEM